MQELTPKTEKRIDQEALLQLGDQGGLLRNTFTDYVSTKEELQELKSKTLAAIVDTSPPMTLQLQGHGSRKAFYFSDGKIMTEDQVQSVEDSSLISITSEEVAAALVKRYQNPEITRGIQASRPDLIIWGTCFSYDQIERVDKQARKSGIPSPIFLAQSEAGQYGYSSTYVKYGSQFQEKVLLQSGKKGLVNLGDIMKIDSDRTLDSNPALFVPDEDGEAIQISGIFNEANDERSLV